MSALPSLIRLQRWRLEEKRRVLASLQGLMADLHNRASQLESEIVREQQAAAASHEAGFIYGSYAAEAIRRRKNIDLSIADVEDQIVVAHDEVSAAFQEAKRFEIALERAQERERQETERREQADQDEIALNVFRRRQA